MWPFPAVAPASHTMARMPLPLTFSPRVDAALMLRIRILESGIDTIVAERDGESEDYVDGEIAQAKNAFLFYPTLVHNLIKNKVEAQFHWWDEVDQKYDPGGSDHAFVYQHLLILLPYRSRNPVPFASDVPRLKQLGVRGVITLNQPYETLVPSSLYQVHGIDHLLIPTTDYLFSPSPRDISRAVDFIHVIEEQYLLLLSGNASCGKTTLMFTTKQEGDEALPIVLCLWTNASTMYQNFQAVQEYSRRTLELPAVAPSTAYFLAGDDEVLLTETDLEGYDLDEDFEGFNTPSKIAEADMLTCSIRDDEVLVSEADLEGYSTPSRMLVKISVFQQMRLWEPEP
ncbi:hypothetical protein B296_00006754 [Ensete ventricosum]|uniref:Uncharacterized protein n=1 Tax=Ensete ventricosum TaxID=4639 RepID=A0A426YJW0_ENSVE|nr:hypothetical protein B296_00006754 [Ensete ventricosum]